MEPIKIAESNKLNRISGELYQSLFCKRRPKDLKEYELELYFERATDYHCLNDAKKLIKLMKGESMGKKSYETLKKELEETKDKLEKANKELEINSGKQNDLGASILEEKLYKEKISHRAEVAYYRALINEFCPAEVIEVLDMEGYIGE